MNCANLDMLFVSSVFKRNSDIFFSVFLPRKQAIPVNSDTSPFSIALSTMFSRDFFDKNGASAFIPSKLSPSILETTSSSASSP